jgi:hypothetical protein
MRFIAFFGTLLWAGAASAAATTASLNVGPGGVPGPTNTITLTDASGAGETNYPFQFGRPFVDGAIPHAPQVLINGVPATSQGDVKIRYPDGSVEFAVLAVVIPSVPAGGSVTLSFQDTTATSTPLTLARMEALLPVGAASMTLTPPTGGSGGGGADAGIMLAVGFCTPWTAGSVAQTMICRDDLNRKYDIGFGDGYHPFRPSFYVTFWPGLNATATRVMGENGNSTEIENVSYNLSVSVGSTTHTTDLTGDQKTHPKIHWPGAAWVLGPYWVGAAAPNPEVNINYNLAYLASTRFIPNFDASTVVPPTSAAGDYAQWGTTLVHDIFDGSWDGGSAMVNVALGVGGASPWLGPYPTWIVNWLYTGDWRERILALGTADGYLSEGDMFRESDPTRRFLRSEAVGAGTGMGRAMSIAGRPGIMFNLFPKICSAALPNGTKMTVGEAFCYGWSDPVPLISATLYTGVANPWEGWAYDHQPDMYSAQYMNTGDPIYLAAMQQISGAGLASIYPYPSKAQGRGVEGAHANIVDEFRGYAWGLRNTALVAFLSPDGTPEKTYFTSMTNDLLADWAGMLEITGTAYDGTPMYAWAKKHGNSQGGPAGVNQILDFVDTAENANAVTDGIYSSDVGAITDNWMDYYVLSSLGRVIELGFPAEPILNYAMQYPLAEIAYNPLMLDIYETPVTDTAGTPYPNIQAVYASLGAPWATGVGFVPAKNPVGTYGETLPAVFASDTAPDGRYVWLQPGMASAVDNGLTTWTYWATVQAAVNAKGGYGRNPQWDVIPRTDTNVLPAQPYPSP